MKLRYSVKFRAFNWTFGTVKGDAPLDSFVSAILGAISKNIGVAIPIAPNMVAAQLKLPMKIYDDRGVFLEVVKG